MNKKKKTLVTLLALGIAWKAITLGIVYYKTHKEQIDKYFQSKNIYYDSNYNTIDSTGRINFH